MCGILSHISFKMQELKQCPPKLCEARQELWPKGESMGIGGSCAIWVIKCTSLWVVRQEQCRGKRRGECEGWAAIRELNYTPANSRDIKVMGWELCLLFPPSGKHS